MRARLATSCGPLGLLNAKCRRAAVIALTASWLAVTATGEEHPRRFLRRLRPKRSPRPTFPNARRKWEPSPIPSSTPEQLAAPEPELPIERAEPEVSINDHPVNENVRRFRYHFSVTVRTVYDDNINLRTVHPSSDFYTSFEPTVRLTWVNPELKVITSCNSSMRPTSSSSTTFHRRRFSTAESTTAVTTMPT